MPQIARIILPLTLLAVVWIMAPVAEASGSSSGNTATETETEVLTPEQLAVQSYNLGLSERDRAWKLETKLASVPDAKRAKTEQKIRKAYERAAGQFLDAIRNDSNYHPALASLGYVTRQLGDYDEALRYYDRALEIDPDYPEAIEYRAEAYLALDRPDDAMAEWDSLKAKSQKMADELALAVKIWVDLRREEMRDFKVGDLDRIERWADERMDGRNVASSLRKSRSW